MNGQLSKFLDIVRNDGKHFCVVGGNIFDITTVGALHPDFVQAILNVTQKKFPNFILYDLFSGIQVLRGDKEAVTKMTHKNDRASSGSSNTDALSRAFDQLNAAQNLAQQNESSPLCAFRVFDRILHEPLGNKSIIVIQYADVFFQNANGAISQFDIATLQTALHKWALDEDIHKNGHIMLCVGKHVNETAGSLFDRCGCVHHMQIPKPNEDERIEYLMYSLSVPEARARVLGKACGGLSLKEIQRLCSSFDDSLTDEQMLDRCFLVKKAVLQEEYGDVLEIMGTSYGFDAIGGLEKPIAKMKAIAHAMRVGKTALVPQGIAFFGPPGTGKTILMQATAREAGVNAVRARDLKNMFLGESERLKTRFHNALKDVAPVIVLVDELDQAYKERGSYDGDSGVSKDFFKKDLELMSDPSLRGKILFIFASNRPDLIDSALKRAGRCDYRVPFPPFGGYELEKICRAALVQHPEIKSNVKSFFPFAERCEGYNGADMIEVVRRAWEHTIYDDRDAINEEDMEWACGDYIPQKSDEIEQARMTLLAFRECSSMSLLPDNWKELHEKYGKILMEHGGTDNIDTLLYPSRNSARIMSAG